MSSFTSHMRIPVLLRIFAIVALVMASFVASAQAGPGRGGDHGRPGDESDDSGHGRGHGRGGGGREGRPGQTRLKLRLTSHHFESGSDVTGTVGLQARTDKKWGPLSGEVVVFVDRTEAGSVTTSAEAGKAEVAIPGLADGGHVVRVHYAGDATHRRARHAQGLNVGTPPGCEDEAADEDDDDDAFFAPRHGEGPKDGHGGRGRGRDKDKPKDDRCPKDDETTTFDDDAAKEEDDEDGKEDDDDDDGLDTTGDDSQDTGDEDTDSVSIDDSIDTTGDTGETIE